MESKGNIDENVELNALQMLFVSLNTSWDKEKVDEYISDNELVKYEFPSGGTYYIGFDSAAIRQRGRDRVGMAVDIDFTENGTVKSAQYAVHTEATTRYRLKMQNGIFYFDDEVCGNGEEAMQKFLSEQNE